MPRRVTRRSFLGQVGQSAAIAGAALTAESTPRFARAALGANGKVRLGFIGLGGRGSYLLDVFRHQPDVEVAAVCDVMRSRAEAGRQQAGGKYDRIVMVGTQQRSMREYQEAVEFVQSGKLGKITECRAWNMDNLAPGGFGHPPDSDPPADLDWDLWLGPAPKVPYNPNRF